MKNKLLKAAVLSGCILFCPGLASAEAVDIFSLPGGEISAGSNPADIQKLVDNNPDTEYSFSGLPNVIVFRAVKSYAPSRCSFTSSSQSADLDPLAWELAGSVDGTAWVTIRTSTNQSFSGRKQEKSTAINSTQPYFYFRLTINRVKNNGNNGALSEWRLLGEEKEIPRAPANLRLNPFAAGQVKLSWRDNSDNEDSFEIQRTADGTNFVAVATVPANTTSYLDASANADAPYIYRICAVSERVKSDYSISNAAITPAFQALTSLTAYKVYTASDQRNNSPEAERVGNAFDDDRTTKFLTRNASTWVRIEFSEPYPVKQYSITSANDSPTRDPKKWTLQGSANGSSWTSLDARENQQFDARFQKRFFEIENTTAYKFYRLNIEANGGDGNTQLADWLLYADITPAWEARESASPANFNGEILAFHLTRLTWEDVVGEAGYRVERSTDGGATYTHTYDVPANNTQLYAYALQPETAYKFKLYSVNTEGAPMADPVYFDVTTPKKEWIETWENLNLWIFDEPVNVKKVKEIGNVAFYLLEKDSPEAISDIYYEMYAQNWEYVQATYGDVLSDPRLHVMLFPLDDGGGLASIHDYRSSTSRYSNMVYIKAYKDWFKGNSKTGFIYDVMSHELCHIIEGIGSGYKESMFYPIWGDSKWAEIFQYDIFKGMNIPRADSWHEEHIRANNPDGGADYPDTARVSYWYRDFLYPTYDKYGKTELLKKFWKLQAEHYRKKNGDLQGSSENPGGRGNLGELIHFWSGAAGTDVKPYAIKAFGWNDRFEMWWQRARADYPGVTYDEAEIDASEKNICQNGGTLSFNLNSRNNPASLTNNNYNSTFLVSKDENSTPLLLTYLSPLPAKIKRYTVAMKDEVALPSLTLSGSVDGEKWSVIDRQNTPDFTGENKIKTVNISESPAYRYFRFEFEFGENKQINLAEVELHGIEYVSAPSDLKAQKRSETSVYLDWGCTLGDVASFEIERSTNGTDFTKIDDAGLYEISYIDDLSVPGAYYYRVKAKNKNPEKETVLSNTAYINTLLNSLAETEKEAHSFYEIAGSLSRYPDNRVKVYSIVGQKVFDKPYPANDLLPRLSATLTPGVYIVAIEIAGNNAKQVKGKILVQ
jgi:hypothetical protein